MSFQCFECTVPNDGNVRSSSWRLTFYAFNIFSNKQHNIVENGFYILTDKENVLRVPRSMHSIDLFCRYHITSSPYFSNGSKQSWYDFPLSRSSLYSFVDIFTWFIKYIYYWFWFLVFNATFRNISAISWRPVLVVEEAGIPGEYHRPWASNW